MELLLYGTVLSVIVSVCSSSEFRACDVDAECIQEARCYRDECARCECDAGHIITNYIVDNNVGSVEMCFKQEPKKKIGDACQHESYLCPRRAPCDGNVCACAKDMVANEQGTQCRYALFGERCGHVQCDYGLACRGHPPLCQCADGFHSADPWRRYIDKRWNITRIGVENDCMLRSIGEACTEDSQCSAIDGTRAECKCGFCQCRVEGHVPDVLGEVCGPALSHGDECTIDGDKICDGTQGLQCGSVCDFYSGDYSTKTCSCSTMHQDVNGVCLPKIRTDRCRADLDCYLLVGGFGICENRTCILADEIVEHIPRDLSRKCHAAVTSIASTEPTTSSGSKPKASTYTTATQQYTVSSVSDSINGDADSFNRTTMSSIITVFATKNIVKSSTEESRTVLESGPNTEYVLLNDTKTVATQSPHTMEDSKYEQNKGDVVVNVSPQDPFSKAAYGQPNHFLCFIYLLLVWVLNVKKYT